MKTKIIASLLLITVLSSCSLLKFQPQFGTEALSKQDLNTRMAVRSYYKSFTGQVIQAADSIVASTEEPSIKAEAIKWKGAATSACARTAFQSDAEIALVDTWLLAKQMDAYLQARGTVHFGELSPIAEACANELVSEIQQMAKRSNDKKHYEELLSFVEAYPLTSELYEWQFSKFDTRPLLIEHLQIPDSLYTSTIGTGAEVMNDFTDRMSVYNEQIQSQLAWEKDLILLTLENDSLAEPYLARIDSLSQMLNRLAIVAQESPEMMGIIAVRMREELTPVLHDFNTGMRTSIYELSQERQHLQKYLDEQRVLLRDDIQQSGKVLIKETTDNLIRFIRRISRLIVFVVIVLVTVIFGLPFTLGYLLAKARFKSRQSTKKDE
ncbi:hypothetical protein KEM09_07580 [Carboxylicivirga mesophila]|uniref:Chemotaxis protein n=1 Tax=Carboxylicivirga mesophila TaxID=1166478 RepID=A0ABS5K8H7_9BACT|nr:hypothetical protein [Carboxylicivirga mesophila]MBS2211255.1 hypothetical protein [Carboxylicivirga mesophila]